MQVRREATSTAARSSLPAWRERERRHSTSSDGKDVLKIRFEVGLLKSTLHSDRANQRALDDVVADVDKYLRNRFAALEVENFLPISGTPKVRSQTALHTDSQLSGVST